MMVSRPTSVLVEDPPEMVSTKVSGSSVSVVSVETVGSEKSLPQFSGVATVKVSRWASLGLEHEPEPMESTRYCPKSR